MTLKREVLAVLVMAGLMVGSAQAPSVAAQPIPFGDVYSRPIAGPSPPARHNQLFTVWYSVRNAGPGNARDVVLTINPIDDPSVFVHSVIPPPGRSCAGTAPIICPLGNLGTSGGVLAMGVRYVATEPGVYATDQYVVASNDLNTSNDATSALITVNP